MKTLMLTALGTAALALTACGEAGRLHSLPPEAPPTTAESPPQQAEQPPEGRQYELRLRGENTEGYGAALLPIRALRVTTPEGELLPVRLRARTLELTAPDHAHLVGHFFVPQGVERVHVALRFGDFGGWEGREGAGALEARGSPLTFEAPVDYLEQRGRAVVHLDVGRSLVPASEGRRLLLPALMVNY